MFDPQQPYVRQIDNGETGSTFSSGWTRITGRGAAQDIHTTSAGTGNRQTNWKFNELPNGSYRIYATWVSGSTNASNAPFTA